MPRKSLRRRRRRSSKKSKKTFTKQLTKRSKSKKIRGGVTTRNGVRRGNYRFLSTLKAQDLTRLNPDIIGEIREMHPLLTTKLNNITLRHAVKDYLSSYVKDKRFIILKYGEIGDWDVSNVTNTLGSRAERACERQSAVKRFSLRKSSHSYLFLEVRQLPPVRRQSASLQQQCAAAAEQQPEQRRAPAAEPSCSGWKKTQRWTPTPPRRRNARRRRSPRRSRTRAASRFASSTATAP